jgi:hypothetical protein
LRAQFLHPSSLILQPTRTPEELMAKKPPTPTVPVHASRCPACGSTSREPYHHTRTLEHAGEHDGRPYTRVVWRRTVCTGCGRARVDKTYENATGCASEQV